MLFEFREMKTNTVLATLTLVDGQDIHSVMNRLRGGEINVCRPLTRVAAKVENAPVPAPPVDEDEDEEETEVLGAVNLNRKQRRGR